MHLRRLATVAASLVAFASVAGANEFVTSSRSDWFRFTGPSGQEVTTQISMESGGWRLWDEFGGLGSRWVYTNSTSDWVWIWDGQNAQPFANLSGAVGTYRTVDLGAPQLGRVQVAARTQQLTTPAGAFTDVTQLTLQTTTASSGVSAIWFAREVGVVKYRTQSSGGAREFVLSAASVGGRSFPSAPTPAPATANPRAPSEHAPIESILWGCSDSYLILPTYTDAFRGLDGSGVPSQVFVDSNQTAAEIRYEMNQASVPLDDVSFVVSTVESVWMRDYGPIVLKGANGERLVADLDYYPGRPLDDRVPRAFANLRGWRTVDLDLFYEGGAFVTNGNGQAMTSLGVQWFNRGKTVADIAREFRKLGCERVEYFEPLIDEGTTHMDMFVRIMSDTQAIVSRYPSNHRQYRVTEDAATKMRALGYTLTRLDAAISHDEYATYANATIANGIALIPTYGDAAKDRAALDAYRGLGFRAVGVDSRLIIQYGGATHCVSMQVPR